MRPFTNPIHPDRLRELLDLTIEGDDSTHSMAEMQLKGIAALYNILCERNLAYLADEVGMGKTYQALGLAAMLWNEKPNARILFISPRENLQTKWSDEYRRFFASNYRRQQGMGDDRVSSVLFGEPTHRPEVFLNLRVWATTIGRPGVAAFLRHSSFRGPVYLKSRDLENQDQSWESLEQLLLQCGLSVPERPEGLLNSRSLNELFAQGVNDKLQREREIPDEPYYDLVIIDEAQCLRHKGNQTNSVLFHALKGQTRKWLFMSATPAHGSPRDIPQILNHYPNEGTILPEELVQDLPRLQAELQPLMVRRQRQYRIQAEPGSIDKTSYREHDVQEWGVQGHEMSVLGALTMGLVQKGMVNILQGSNNRYRVGFLSSFESLQSSLRSSSQKQETEEEGSKTDWHKGQSNRVEEVEAPDTGFIQQIATSFEEQFNRSLPHPKVDFVVEQVAASTFGTQGGEEGEKVLIFTRRISTVATLKSRLMRQFHRSIEERIQRCWGERLDWDGTGVTIEEVEEDGDLEGDAEEVEGSRFHKALSAKNKGWLSRYRNTFRASGRNALFFEDSWLERLCLAGGVKPEDASRELPDELWKESWTHALRSSGKQQYKAMRLRYLAVQAVRRCPEVFGLTEETARPWKDAYENILHDHLEQADPAEEIHVDEDLFTFPTLWGRWDQFFNEGDAVLPASQPTRVSMEGDVESLYRRQIVRTILGQVFRSTDTILDLFYADKSKEDQGTEQKKCLADTFLSWMQSEDRSAVRLLCECSQWIQFHQILLDKCLDGGGVSLTELARKEYWETLRYLTPVGAVTGGRQPKNITRQFCTPTYPRIIVCTDTLKEGVDLHLFCDRVLHYGVAWTSGDLEQRVGRVDRFFSQIERRLSSSPTPDEVKLHVGYPHIVSSLERDQVLRVIERQKVAEALMSSPLGAQVEKEKEFVSGLKGRLQQKVQLGPYEEHHFEERYKDREVLSVSADNSRAIARHYTEWFQELVRFIKARDWQLSPSSNQIQRTSTLFPTGMLLQQETKLHQHDLEWSFDAGLSRYILTLTEPDWAQDGSFTGGRRKRKGSTREYFFLRVLVPTLEEEVDVHVIERFCRALEGEAPKANQEGRFFWQEALSTSSVHDLQWGEDHRAHRASFVVHTTGHNQKMTLYAYKGGVRILGKVAELKDLKNRLEWDGAPTAKNVRKWALEETYKLPLGYLDVHERDGLVFGVHVLHGNLSPAARGKLIDEVAWRADYWREEFLMEEME
jgi:hypothetical protein